MEVDHSNDFETVVMNDDEYTIRRFIRISNEVEIVMKMTMNLMICETNKQFVYVHVYHSKNKYCF